MVSDFSDLEIWSDTDRIYDLEITDRNMDINEYIKEGTKTPMWTAFRQLFSNHEMMKVEIKKLKLALSNFETTNEEIKEIIKELKLWVNELDKGIDFLEEARTIFRNRKIITELEDEPKMEALF